MDNQLFSFLIRSDIFKDNSRFTFAGQRMLASEKTEFQRQEKTRGKPFWNPKKQGTYIRKV